MTEWAQVIASQVEVWTRAKLQAQGRREDDEFVLVVERIGGGGDFTVGANGAARVMEIIKAMRAPHVVLYATDDEYDALRDAFRNCVRVH